MLVKRNNRKFRISVSYTDAKQYEIKCEDATLVILYERLMQLSMALLVLSAASLLAVSNEVDGLSYKVLSVLVILFILSTLVFSLQAMSVGIYADRSITKFSTETTVDAQTLRADIDNVVTELSNSMDAKIQNAVRKKQRNTELEKVVKEVKF